MQFSALSNTFYIKFYIQVNILVLSEMRKQEINAGKTESQAEMSHR